MGYAFGKGQQGQDIGYGVVAPCDEPGCTKEIDRGMAYACGGDPHDTEYCGRHYCYDHLIVGGPAQMCKRCAEKHWVEIGP